VAAAGYECPAGTELGVPLDGWWRSGLASALVLGRFLEGILYEVAPTDLLAYVLAAAAPPSSPDWLRCCPPGERRPSIRWWRFAPAETPPR
jgi:hypothetical protein